MIMHMRMSQGVSAFIMNLLIIYYLSSKSTMSLWGPWRSPRIIWDQDWCLAWDPRTIQIALSQIHASWTHLQVLREYYVVFSTLSLQSWHLHGNPNRVLHLPTWRPPKIVGKFMAVRPLFGYRLAELGHFQNLMTFIWQMDSGCRRQQ